MYKLKHIYIKRDRIDNLKELVNLKSKYLLKIYGIISLYPIDLLNYEIFDKFYIHFNFNFDSNIKTNIIDDLIKYLNKKNIYDDTNIIILILEYYDKTADYFINK